MENSLYYLLVALPPLPRIGERPPITLEEIWHLVQEGSNGKINTLVRAFLMEQAFKMVVQEKIMMNSDTSPSVAGEMPGVLAQALQNDLRVLGEDVWLTAAWRAFFLILQETGETIGSRLLCRWTSWETSLREQLMIARGGCPPTDGAPSIELCGVIDSWASQSDPMIGERILDEARWQFIDQEVRPYSFDLDELTAYLLKLGLLSRHASLSRERGVKILEEITIL